MEQNNNMADLYGMSQTDYLREYFNKTDTLTAVYLGESYTELDTGKEYKVSYISVGRSSSMILLEGFENKEYNTIHFKILENGKEIEYTKEKRFLSPHLLKVHKAMQEHYSIKERILGHLHEIEQQQHVKILYAVESGSRAWGFASPDSDWDVRFIYVHEPEWYFHIEEQKDTIEQMFPDETDMSGWDLKKALRLFKRSNPSLFEWLHSPIIYCKDEKFIGEIQQMEDQYFNREKAMFHYNHIYKKHNDRYIKDYGLPLKRFLYYLRGILVCKWLTDEGTVPPVRFSELVNATVEDTSIKEKIAHLLQLKKKSNEHNLEPVDEQLFSWAQEWAKFYDKKVEQIHPGKKTCLDDKLNKLMYDTVNRMAMEITNAPSVQLFN